MYLINRIGFAMVLTVALSACGQNDGEVKPTSPNVTAAPVATPIGGGHGLIAFESNRSSGEGIYLIRPDGSGLTPLTQDADDGVNLSWSPDGQRIAFISRRDGNAEIYLVNVVDAAESRLTLTPDDEDSPAWSPDGRRIAFEATRELPGDATGFPDYQSDIFVINVDGSGLTRLTDNDTATHRDPAWSPDGAHIVFVSISRSGSSGLYIMKPDGTEVIQLVNWGEPIWTPAWSPDGRRIAFGAPSDVIKLGGSLYVVTVADRKIRRLTGDSGRSDWEPCWSPDGTKIVFDATQVGDLGRQIYVMDSDGSNVRQVTDDSAESNMAPKWSP